MYDYHRDRIPTREDVLAADKVYYGAQTCWWTIDPKDLHEHPKVPGLPTDPRGGVLLETPSPEAFLEAAESNPDHYGRRGMDAFWAAYNGVITVADGRPTCFNSWHQYNIVLDLAYPVEATTEGE